MPVRWVETIQKFSQQGIVEVIECGPGKVLSGLIKRISRDIGCTTTSDLAVLKGFLKLNGAQNVTNF